jgi:hypothetical protein
VFIGSTVWRWGYEDINDHEQRRKDPVFGILAGRVELEEPLAARVPCVLAYRYDEPLQNPELA